MMQHLTSAAALAALDVRRTPDTRLGAEARPALSALLPDWVAAPDEILQRTFAFADYHATMAFVNAVAWVAHRADHHPDLVVGYNRCTVSWSTHSAGGLTLKDFICAAQVDALLWPTA